MKKRMAVFIGMALIAISLCACLPLRKDPAAKESSVPETKQAKSTTSTAATTAETTAETPPETTINGTTKFVFDWKPNSDAIIRLAKEDDYLTVLNYPDDQKNDKAVVFYGTVVDVVDNTQNEADSYKITIYQNSDPTQIWILGFLDKVDSIIPEIGDYVKAYGLVQGVRYIDEADPSTYYVSAVSFYVELATKP